VYKRQQIGYRTTFLIAAVGALAAAWFVSRLRPVETKEGRRPRFVWKRRYSLFYLLNVFSGARKQVFMTFGPWVLVQVFGEPPQTIAKLWIVASAIGIFFQPQLGRLIDRVGERVVLIGGSLALMGVCLGYGFAEEMPIANPVRLVYICYVLDHLLFATGIARATYLDKIAESREDIHPSLSLGVTIDHAVSMSIPALGGLVWMVYGYPYVFLGATAIAVMNMIAAAFIRVPPRRTEAQGVRVGGGRDWSKLDGK